MQDRNAHINQRRRFIPIIYSPIAHHSPIHTSGTDHHRNFVHYPDAPVRLRSHHRPLHHQLTANRPLAPAIGYRPNLTTTIAPAPLSDTTHISPRRSPSLQLAVDQPIAPRWAFSAQRPALRQFYFFFYYFRYRYYQYFHYFIISFHLPFSGTNLLLAVAIYRAVCILFPAG